MKVWRQKKKTTNGRILLLKESVLCNMQIEHLQTCPLSQLILQGYEDTCKVCRKGDIHGWVTEGHMPGVMVNLPPHKIFPPGGRIF